MILLGYICRIAVVMYTKGGNSTAAESSDCTTLQDKPSVVRNLAIPELLYTHTSLTVTWEEPAHANGILTGQLLSLPAVLGDSD